MESSRMTTEDDVNLSVTGICGFPFLLKNYFLRQTKVIKKEIEGTALSQVSDMQIIQEMGVIVERRC